MSAAKIEAESLSESTRRAYKRITRKLIAELNDDELDEFIKDDNSTLKKPLSLRMARELLEKTQLRTLPNGTTVINSSSSDGQCTSGIKYWHDESERMSPGTDGSLLMRPEVSRCLRSFHKGIRHASASLR